MLDNKSRFDRFFFSQIVPVSEKWFFLTGNDWGRGRGMMERGGIGVKRERWFFSSNRALLSSTFTTIAKKTKIFKKHTYYPSKTSKNNWIIRLIWSTFFSNRALLMITLRHVTLHSIYFGRNRTPIGTFVHIMGEFYFVNKLKSPTLVSR